MSAIRTDGLEKHYGGVDALSGLSLSVDAGELFGLLGPNGAGKTTTIKILTGQTVPDAGSASVLGLDPAAQPVETRRQVGILPEQTSPPSFLTPREYFDFVAEIREIPADAVDTRVSGWVDRLGYREKLDTLTTDLSRGQQQKVMVTAAFLHEPELVFIDEPLANLDPIVQERLKEFLAGYADGGNTVFLSTHHVEVAEQLCSRVGVVDGGELVAERRPAALGDGESLLDAFLDDVGTTAFETTVEGGRP